MKNASPGPRIIAENKKALFDYEIIEIFEVGIKLFGEEVKSVRAGLVNLKGSYVSIGVNTARLIGAHISRYKQGAREFDPKRERILLLRKSEIFHIHSKVKELGATCVLLSLMTQGNLIKGRCALVRGRKKWQKKQVLKERDLDREKSAIMRNFSL